MEWPSIKVDPMEAASWMMENGMPEGRHHTARTSARKRYRRVSKEAERLGVPMDAPTCCSPGPLALQFD